MNIKFFKSKKQVIDIINHDYEEWPTMSTTELYGQTVGFYDDGDLIGLCNFSTYDDELHIYVFEIADSCRRMGYGSECYNMLIESMQDEIHKITLDYLDDSAAAFWKALGFVEDPDGDSPEAMKLDL